MKNQLIAFSAVAAAVASASAEEGLYYIGSEAQESLPLTWVVGANVTWDDNVTPTAPAFIGGLPNPAHEDEAFSVNPYVGVSFVNMTPQSTLDVYARLGVIYYLDEPAGLGTDDFYTQARAGVNWTYRVSERLRFSSRNFISYELEPDYAYGFATSRQAGEYFYWQTDNSIGYRWTERFATYTGFQLTGLNYDSSVPNADRFTVTLYNQFRYQLTPQSVLTFDYRYADTNGDGLASDSESHYLLGGVEHRFSPNTIMVLRAGAQIRQSGTGDDSTSPYLELALRSQINEAFSVRAFARYGMENYDNVKPTPVGLVDFDDRRTFRLGVSGEYVISPMLSLFGGVDLITADFDDGRFAGTAVPAGVSSSEDLWNAYLGLSVKFTDSIYGTLTYNHTDSDSDFIGSTYERNRVTVGVRAEF